MSDNESPVKTEDFLGKLINLTAQCSNRQTALEQLSELCCDALQAKSCTIVEVDLERRFLIQIANAGLDENYRRFNGQRRIRLGSPESGDFINYDIIAKGTVIETNKLWEEGNGIANPGIARRHGLRSALCYPLNLRSHFHGYLNVFFAEDRTSFPSEKRLLEHFVRQAEVILEKFDAARWLQVLETINNATTEMARENSIDKIFSILLRTCLKITNAEYGWIRRLNYSTGELETVSNRSNFSLPRALKYGKGITWRALIKEQPQLVDDVTSDPDYAEHTSITRSELAIPLLVEQVYVRERDKPKLKSRPIGVFNLESSEYGAFSKDDITFLRPLLQQAALLIDRLEAEKKLKGLLEVETKILKERNWREVLKLVAKEIKDTLDFEFVNISLVSSDGNSIKTEYVLGLSEEDTEIFKSMAVHSLNASENDSDIQAVVINTGKVLVPDKDDLHFDKEIFNRFGHDKLIRVFVPIFAPSTGKPIGTIEAGYQRNNRNSIDERDIQFIQIFAASAGEVIDPQNRNLLARVRHELLSSVTGIKGNADYLRLMRKSLSEEMIQNKLEDILTDCEILIVNVEEIEFLLGRPPQERVEETYIVKDIIIKTAKQLKPFAKGRGFDPSRIEYPLNEARRIKMRVDKGKLNQVVNNLLTNAIKYAEKEPEKFRVQVKIEEQPEQFIIKFSDSGIGIKEEYKERIFNLGFRAPEAEDLDVSGSGLGLTIARDRIREIGGDLILARNGKPTVFHLLIPKRLTETHK